MSYKTPLETRIAKKVTRAITEHNLIEDGDRVMVGLSGGKDSWALIQILDVLQKRAPIDFSLVAVNIDSGYEGYEHHKLTETCAPRGWELPRRAHEDRRDASRTSSTSSETPCSLCARLRRGALYRLADRGRRDQDRARPSRRRLHRDAAAERLLPGLAQGDAGAARLRQRPARRHPSAGLRDSSRRRAPTRRRAALPIIGCCCPACGDLSLQRQRVKRLIAQLEVEHPEIKNSMLARSATSPAATCSTDV